MRRSRSKPSLRDLLAGAIALELPLRFNARLLSRDLPALDSEPWVVKLDYAVKDHFVNNGTWEILTLRGPRKRRAGNNVYMSGPFADYEALSRSPRLARAVASLPGEKCAVQLLNLVAGGALTRHSDAIFRYRGRDLVQVHIPVATNPSARFFINGQPLVMRAGSAWTINNRLPHEVYNMGRRDRVHLVVYLVWDNAVAALMRRARRVEDDPAKAPRAAAEHARRYLRDFASHPRTPAGLEPPERAARRQAAVISELMRMSMEGEPRP